MNIVLQVRETVILSNATAQVKLSPEIEAIENQVVVASTSVARPITDVVVTYTPHQRRVEGKDVVDLPFPMTHVGVDIVGLTRLAPVGRDSTRRRGNHTAPNYVR